MGGGTGDGDDDDNDPADPATAGPIFALWYLKG